MQDHGTIIAHIHYSRDINWTKTLSNNLAHFSNVAFCNLCISVVDIHLIEVHTGTRTLYTGMSVAVLFIISTDLESFCGAAELFDVF